MLYIDRVELIAPPEYLLSGREPKPIYSLTMTVREFALKASEWKEDAEYNYSLLQALKAWKAELSQKQENGSIKGAL